jgi:carbonic anhydrase/acetyltransferase-like protein (isoleucine patch superfamily)
VVVKDDNNHVFIENNSQIMDNTIISTVAHTHTGVRSMVQIGSYTKILPNCSISSCFIGSNVFIGSGTVVIEDVKIENNIKIESGSVVSPGILLESGKR